MEPRRLQDLAFGLARSPLPYFAALSVWLLFLHEPWRDEAEHWLLVRDTPTMGAFFEALRYEGTPSLWHMLMMPLAKLGLPFMSARILHVAVAVAGVSAIWFLSPFSRREKWLLAFGYYTAYEFSAITRSYALFVLLLFVVARLDRERRARPILYALALAALANTTLHGLLIAAIVAAGYGLGLLRNRAWTRTVTVGAGLAVAGFALAAWQMRPPADLAPWLAHWHVMPPDDPPRVYDVVKSILEGFVPIPTTQQDFWNSSIFQALPASVMTLLAAGILAASFWTLRHQRDILWTYAAIMLVMQSLFVFKYYGGAHHAGLLFFVYLYCLWIVRARGPEAAIPPGGAGRSERAPDWRVRGQKALTFFVPVILALQVVAAGMAIERDARGQFSASGEAARFLEDHGLVGEDTFVAAYHSFAATGILAQLRDPDRQFFLVELNRSGTFTPWSAQWQASTHLSINEVLARVDAAAIGYDRVVLIINYDGTSPPGWVDGTTRLTWLTTIGAGVVGSLEEQFDIYIVQPPAPA